MGQLPEGAVTLIETEADALAYEPRDPQNLAFVTQTTLSVDDTARIVAAVAAEHPCIRLIRAEHGGQAAARNRAIAAAQGTFIAPLDADDLWDTRKVELQVERALAGPHPPKMVYCFHYRIDEEDRVLAAPEAVALEGWVFHRLYYQNVVGTGSAPLFLRSAVMEAGGYTKAGNSEDALLQLRIARRHPIAVVAERLVGYRVTPGSHTQRHESALQNWLAARTMFEAEWPGIPRRLRRWTRSVRWLQFAETMAWQRRWGRSAGALLRAWWLDPARSTQVLTYRLARSVARRLRSAPAQSAGERPVFGARLPFAAAPHDPHALHTLDAWLRALERRRMNSLAALDVPLAPEITR